MMTTASCLLVWLCCAADTLSTDERVVFFPTLAHYDPVRNEWRGEVHGWIYEVDRKTRVRSAAFRELLEFDRSVDEAKLFRQRAEPFVVDNEGGKQLRVRLGSERHAMSPSSSDGHFRGTVILSAKEVDALRQPDSTAAVQWLPFVAADVVREYPQFAGRLGLVEPTGLSVVSDIDDTIKISEVRDKRRLLERTFLEPFEAAPRMAEAYQKLAAQGGMFHYLSAGPWQLYPALAEFQRQAKLPDGSWHLKRFAWDTDGAKALFAEPEQHKLPLIESLFRAAPRRQFILIGDSGERDPEIYASIVRRYPDQVRRIVIRNVTHEPRESPRYRELFRAVREAQWQIIADGAEIEPD